MSQTFSLPTTYLRLPQLCALLGGIGRSTAWRWVKTGRLPPPIKLGPRVSVWRATDIAAFIESQSKQAADTLN